MYEMSHNSPNSPEGPLHLQRYLTNCTDSLGAVIRSSVGHPVTIVRSLYCRCAPSVRAHAISEEMADPNLAYPLGGAPDRREACRFFLVKTNDELGVVHAFCRRCKRKILAYDRALYWGVKRESYIPPATYPYMCSCGSHTFEMAFGFNYPEDELDENDIDTMTIAVCCASCNEIAVIFDDEAT